MLDCPACQPSCVASTDFQFPARPLLPSRLPCLQNEVNSLKAAAEKHKQLPAQLEAGK